MPRCRAPSPSARSSSASRRAQRGGRAEHAGRAGDVPAAVVVVRVHHVADAARDVDAEHQRVDELAAARADVLGQRERRRRDRSRGMDDRLEMRVVEVEGVRRDAVQRARRWPCRRARCARAPWLAARAASSCTAASAASAASMARRADRAAEPVQKRAVRFALDGVAPAARWMRRRRTRARMRGDRRRVGSAATSVLRAMLRLNAARHRELDVARPSRPRSTRDVVAHVLAELLGRHRHRLERFARQAFSRRSGAFSTC